MPPRPPQARAAGLKREQRAHGFERAALHEGLLREGSPTNLTDAATPSVIKPTSGPAITTPAALGVIYDTLQNDLAGLEEQLRDEIATVTLAQRQRSRR